MKLNKPNSAFYRWWNSYTGRRIVSATYSIGAAVVIQGALFKILHLPFGNIMLTLGMSVESFIFALGIFDKPYREYDWSKIFDFKADKPLDSEQLKGGGGTILKGEGGIKIEGNASVNGGANATGELVTSMNGGANGGYSTSAQPNTSALFSEALSEQDAKKLSESIAHLSKTAESLQMLADLTTTTNDFARNMQSASAIAASYNETQSKLNQQAETLADAYVGINSEINNVSVYTKNYASNIDSINGNIVDIKSNYNQQLEQIKQQTVKLKQQLSSVDAVTSGLNNVSLGMHKLQETTQETLEETQRYKNATRRLTQQVENLNVVYGNMLNALS